MYSSFEVFAYTKVLDQHTLKQTTSLKNYDKPIVGPESIEIADPGLLSPY